MRARHAEPCDHPVQVRVPRGTTVPGPGLALPVPAQHGSTAQRRARRRAFYVSTRAYSTSTRKERDMHARHAEPCDQPVQARVPQGTT